MKTFLKVLLILVGVVVALKVLRLALLGGLGLVGGALGILFGGVSLAAGLAIPLVAIVALLSPLWLPIVAVVALVALVRRNRAAPAAVGTATPPVV